MRREKMARPIRKIDRLFTNTPLNYESVNGHRNEQWRIGLTNMIQQSNIT